jgi:hypothetical protein
MTSILPEFDRDAKSDRLRPPPDQSLSGVGSENRLRVTVARLAHSPPASETAASVSAWLISPASAS